jgi:UrcA family protein
MRSLKPGFLAAALTLTLLTPAAWSKEPERKTQVIGKVHVELKDLDLNNPVDARTLLERLKQAAYLACGGDPKLHNSYRTRPEQTIKVYEECRANAVNRAIDQIGAPLLAQARDEEERRAAARSANASADECADREHSRLLARARDQSGT